MALPIEIFPNPLVTSTVEIRFSINIDPVKLFSIVYPVFAKELPMFEENKIPKNIRMSRDDLKFTPDYILKNDDFSLSFSGNAIAFENVSEYKLWNNYFPFIQRQLNIFFGLGIVNVVTRIGVRYASVFDGKTKIGIVIKEVPKLSIDGYEQLFGLMRVDIKRHDYNFHVQMANNAKSQKNNRMLSGVYVDIDSSFTQDIPPNSRVFEIIDELHHEGKVLFFEQLISKEFLETLKPRY